MDELGIQQSALAEAAGVSAAAISDIFRGETKESRLLPQLNAKLGGVPPAQILVMAPVDDAKAVVDSSWDDLTEEEREHVAQTVRMLLRSRASE